MLDVKTEWDADDHFTNKWSYWKQSLWLQVAINEELVRLNDRLNNAAVSTRWHHGKRAVTWILISKPDNAVATAAVREQRRRYCRRQQYA